MNAFERIRELRQKIREMKKEILTLADDAKIEIMCDRSTDAARRKSDRLIRMMMMVKT